MQSILKNAKAGLIIASIAIVAGLAIGSWVVWHMVSTYRHEQFCERADISRPKDDDARKDVEWRCPGLLPAPGEEGSENVTQPKSHQDREWYDLKAQQEMAAWALGVLLTTLIGLFVSAAGVWALVWTFYEQRNLTRAASRAYLEAVSATLYRSAKTEWILEINIVNVGQTPATHIKTSGEIRFMTKQLEDGAIDFDSWVQQEFKMDRLPNLSAKAGASVTDQFQFSFPFEQLAVGSDLPKRGSAAIAIEGTIEFRDAFGDECVASFLGHVFSLSPDNVNPVYGIRRWARDAIEEEKEQKEWRKSIAASLEAIAKGGSSGAPPDSKGG